LQTVQCYLNRTAKNQCDLFATYWFRAEYDCEAITPVMACSSQFPGEFLSPQVTGAYGNRGGPRSISNISAMNAAERAARDRREN